MRFLDFSGSRQRFGGSHKKTYKKTASRQKKPCHDKKTYVTTQNLLDIFPFFGKFCLACEQSRCTCSV